MGQYPFNTKRPLPLATRYKLIYMPKQSQRILVSPLYNFPLHRETGNLNQMQTSAINCVCEFRFSSQNIFVLINENAAKTVSYLFLATTIMDKSPWDSQNVTSILGVSQVLLQKAELSFYKSMSPPNTIGTLRSDDGDGNGNATKAIGLFSKTTVLHVHHAFLYISLPSLHDDDVKMPNFTMYRGSIQATTRFPLSF